MAVRRQTVDRAKLARLVLGLSRCGESAVVCEVPSGSRLTFFPRPRGRSAVLLLASVCLVLAGIARAEKKARMILRVASFESSGSRSMQWKTDRTLELQDVDGLGDRVKLGVDSETGLPYVEVWPAAVGSTEAPTPTRFSLPRSRKDWAATAISIRLMKDGTVLIPGNETQPGGLGGVPSVWAWRPGSAPSEWKQWILDPKMLARSTKENIWLISAATGFDADTDRLVCIVNKDKEVGLATFEVQIVDP